VRSFSPRRKGAVLPPAPSLAVVLCLVGALPVAAASLREKVDRFYAGPFHAPPQGLMLAELVATTVLPAASAPGFGPQSDALVGPLVTEPAATIGAGHLVVSARYEDIAWTPEVERDRLGNLRGPFVSLATEGRFNIDVLTLRQQRYTVSAAYGIRDDLDLELDLPIVDTHFAARGRAFSDDGTVAGRSLHTSDSAAGDLVLRGKWGMAEVGKTELAAMLTMSLPTGRIDDFAGRETFTLEPSLVSSRSFGRLRVDLDVGIEANASDVGASRGRYRLAASVVIFDWLGASGEIDARTGVSAYKRRVEVPPNFDPSQDYDVTFPRMDLADAFLALHAHVAGPLRVFVAGRIPIAWAGLVPNAVPVVGLTAAF